MRYHAWISSSFPVDTYSTATIAAVLYSLENTSSERLLHSFMYNYMYNRAVYMLVEERNFRALENRDQTAV